MPITRSITIPQEIAVSHIVAVCAACLCNCVMTGAVDFVCPRCTSRYKLVGVRAEPEVPSYLLHCKVCKEPLPPTDGAYALKYFLVDKAKKHNGFDLRMKNAVPKRESRG